MNSSKSYFGVLCKVLTLFLLYLGISPLQALGESIEVTSANLHEVRRLDLPKGHNANVLVYLQSFGDLVEKYLVTLRIESDNKRVKSLLSDRHGRVLFKGIAAGKYRVEVSRRIREDGRLSTVSVGDVVLSASREKIDTTGYQ